MRHSGTTRSEHIDYSIKWQPINTFSLTCAVVIVQYETSGSSVMCYWETSRVLWACTFRNLKTREMNMKQTFLVHLLYATVLQRALMCCFHVNIYYCWRNLQADGLKNGVNNSHRTDPFVAEMLGFMALFSWLSSFQNHILCTLVKFDSFSMSGTERIFIT